MTNREEPSAMRTFTASDGQIIHVQVSGEGPPLVLLHEWASNHRVWGGTARRLEDAFTVYRWDARGHADRPLTGRERASVGRMAEDLAELLDHFGLDRPVVVGHSMGGLTAWEYIARHGCARIARLGILDQSPRLMTDGDWRLGIYYDWPAERDAAFIEGLSSDFVETVLKLIALGKNARARERYEAHDDSIARLRAYLALLDPAPLIAIWQSLAAADWRPVLPRISVPTLLIYGSDSNYYGVEAGAYVRDAIPDARLLVYAGADHSPHLAEPDRFAADLRAFAEAAVTR